MNMLHFEETVYIDSSYQLLDSNKGSNEKQLRYFKCSALDSDGVCDVFEGMAQSIYNLAHKNAN